MNLDTLTAVSPIDGRYSDKCSELQEVFSEYGLIKRRVLVECVWLEALCDAKGVRECKALSASERGALRMIADGFSVDDARRVKEIDPHAFIIITKTSEIMGKGFRDTQ